MKDSTSKPTGCRTRIIWFVGTLAVIAILVTCWEYYSLDGFGGLVFGNLFGGEITEYASGYSDKNFRKVKKGMSEQDVRVLLGEPLVRWNQYSFSTDRSRISNDDEKVESEGWAYSRNPIKKSRAESRESEIEKWGSGSHDFRVRGILFHKGIVTERYSEYWVD